MMLPLLILFFIAARSDAFNYLPPTSTFITRAPKATPSPIPTALGMTAPRSLPSGDDEGAFVNRNLGKAAWLSAEGLGNVVSLLVPGPFAPRGSEPPSTFEEAAGLIRDDYDGDYFLTGLLKNLELYSPDCYFR